MSIPSSGSVRPPRFSRQGGGAGATSDGDVVDDAVVDDVEQALARAAARVDQVVTDTLSHVSAVDVVAGAIDRSSARLAEVAMRRPRAAFVAEESDGEVNAAMAQIVARLNGQPLPSDPQVQEMFSDDEVDQRFGEVAESLTLDSLGVYERDPGIDHLLATVRTPLAPPSPPHRPGVAPSVPETPPFVETPTPPPLPPTTRKVVTPVYPKPILEPLTPAVEAQPETGPEPVDEGFEPFDVPGRSTYEIPGAWLQSAKAARAPEMASISLEDTVEFAALDDTSADGAVPVPLEDSFADWPGLDRPESADADNDLSPVPALAQTASADRLTLSPPPLPLEGEVKERLITRVVLTLLVLGLVVVGTLLAVFLLWVGYTPIWQGR